MLLHSPGDDTVRWYVRGYVKIQLNTVNSTVLCL